jgi:1-acyl-sn-glycerol-3-phosphate acyltransferase
MNPATPPPASRLPAYGWTQAAAVMLARGLARSFCSLEVRGAEHLPADEPCLLCANHTSHADTFAIATAAGRASERLVFLGARDYFTQFHVRRFIVTRVICLVDFDRRATITAGKTNLRTLAACRDDRRIIVLFPEGTRSPDGTLHSFKPGAAMFADKLGLRVIPCRVEGAHAVLPKGRRVPRPAPLRVIFGAPMTVPPAPERETAAERGARYDAFSAALHARVASLGRADASVAAPVLSA